MIHWSSHVPLFFLRGNGYVSGGGIKEAIPAVVVGTKFVVA